MLESAVADDLKDSETITVNKQQYVYSAGILNSWS